MSYDRETGQWQTSWIDNMAARQVLYTGHMSGDSAVVTGQDMWEGIMVYEARITTVKLTDDKFEWYFDMSTDGGESWWTSGKAVYTRVK
jgi:predicted  nucleic acid-binding Zn ribbon protein